MKPFHIIGQPGAGKTTLIVDLLVKLKILKIKAGTIKHSAHVHELDKKGKDSFLHRKAGGCPVAMMTKNMAAIYFDRTEQISPQTILNSQYYKDLDMVIIEGWISGPYNKIEMWRPDVGKKPLFYDVRQVKGLVSDGDVTPEIIETARKKGITCFQRNETDKLITWIIDSL